MPKNEMEINGELNQSLVRELEDLHKNRKGKFILAAYSILRNYEEAEDSVQEAFYLAYASLHTFQERSALATWVYRILINYCLKKNRMKIKELINTETSPDTINQVRDFRGNHVFELEKSEVNSVISQCFDQLDSKYSLPLILYHYVGFGIDSISDILDIPRGTVKSRLHIARRKMGFLLERAFGGKESLEDFLGLF